MANYIRGVRGATICEANSETSILAAAETLLREIVAANDIRPEDVASVLFTVTPDLDAAFPAKAARRLGWVDTALMDAQEMAVPGAPERCIRVLLHWNTTKAQSQIRHVYLGEARRLRPDLNGEPPQPLRTGGEVR